MTAYFFYPQQTPRRRNFIYKIPRFEVFVGLRECAARSNPLVVSNPTVQNTRVNISRAAAADGEAGWFMSEF